MDISTDGLSVLAATLTVITVEQTYRNREVYITFKKFCLT